jgi:hypothetical protein
MGLDEKQLMIISSALTAHYPIIPTFPGPDPPAGWREGLTNKAGVLQASNIKYFSDNNLFQASRSRAGHFPMWMA